MEAINFRLNNNVRCKVSNDGGIYQVSGIDGWIKIFASKEDENKYKAESAPDFDKRIPKDYVCSKWRYERLIRINGGARDKEQYPESKIAGVKITEERLVDHYRFKPSPDDIFYLDDFGVVVETFRRHIILRKVVENVTRIFMIKEDIKFEHQIQNMYFSIYDKEII